MEVVHLANPWHKETDQRTKEKVVKLITCLRFTNPHAYPTIAPLSHN
jgi:hypothetical protein